MAAAAVFAAEAQAAYSMSIGDQGQTAVFGSNAIVRIDGSITYESHCAKPGSNDFFHPATDVYVVPSGETSGTLEDASGGRPNTIVSSASAFTDEVIAMTAPAGNLETGDYVGRDAAGNERTCTTTVSVPRTCTGAQAVQAAREVEKARREDAAGLRAA
jgi:hypothetical protein